MPGIAWIGENFLVASEAGIKNDFAAATGASARRETVKDSPVLERQCGASFQSLRQRCLLVLSFRAGLHCGDGPEVIHRPVCEHGFAVNKFAGNRAEHPRIVGAIAMVAHHEVAALRNPHWPVA